MIVIKSQSKIGAYQTGGEIMEILKLNKSMKTQDKRKISKEN